MAPDSELERRLVQVARDARLRAHAPYSRFLVGAAVIDEQGRIHAGANIENAAYPQGLCAEAAAVAHLVVAGGRAIRAVAVVGVGVEPVTPCGGCRQKLREFAAGDVPVIIADGQGVRLRTTLEALLPHSFGPNHLHRGVQ